MIKILKVILFHCFIVLLLFFILSSPLMAQENNKLKIYFFWGKVCPHCAREKVFLEKLVKKYPQVELKSLETSLPENIRLWQEAGEKLDVKVGGTPFTVIGSRHFTGYLNDEISGQQIEQVVQNALQNGCVDIFKETSLAPIKPCPPDGETIPEAISLPILGKVRIKDFSLPLLTVVMGVLDGFNPCAMWALLFLISLLLGMKDRKRMWLLGTAFVISSAFVYFLFMTAWLNFFLFVGFIIWVRIIIGFVALGAGGYSLRDYFVNKEGGCRTVGNKKREQIFESLKKMTQKKELVFALGGIILLAFAVNLIELVCSAGLPAIYTQVLSLSSLPIWQYYLYLLGYIFFFLVDDLFVFFTAMITLRAVGIESKYARFSRLIGGTLMVIIGGLLLLKPEWLMLG